MALGRKTELCYPHLSFQSRFNTFVGLPFFVNRDFEIFSRSGAFWSYMYQYVSEIWMIAGLISAFIGIYLVWDDINTLFGGISSTSHSMQIVLKVIWLNWNKERFLQQLRRLNSIIERNDLLMVDDESQSFGKYAAGWLRNVRILESVVIVIVGIWTTLYFFPYLYNSMIHQDTVASMHLPIVGFMPFDYSTTPLYQIAIFIQMIWFYFNNFKTVVIDYFILGFVSLHVLQLRYLNVILQRMTEILIQTKDKIDEVRVNGLLQIWIKQHQEFVRSSKATKELLSIYFLIDFAYIVIHTCVPAFVITSTLSWTLNQKIVLIFMCSIGIVTLYVLSVCGDIFSDSSEEFGVTFYGPHLFDRKSWKMTYFMLLSIGRDKSNILGFSNVYPLCSITFGSIMRAVMSAYLALNQINGLKSECKFHVL